jgi:hypothetical protein
MYVSVNHCTVWFIVYICTYMYVSVKHCTVWFIVYICTYMYVLVHRHIHVRTYIDNKSYSTMVHRHKHVRTYIDNKPYSTMVHRHIHVRCKPLYCMVYCLYIYIYVHVCFWEPLYCMVWFIIYICTYMYVSVIHVRTYIDNKPFRTMVHRHIHVRTYIDNKPYNTYTYMYVSENHCTVWYGLLSIYVRTCMCLWTIVLNGLLSI